jgi:hypothetical protein
MEVINNITQSASKAIWGETNANTKAEEPMSGVRGDTSRGEPYDAGNIGKQRCPINFDVVFVSCMHPKYP